MKQRFRFHHFIFMVLCFSMLGLFVTSCGNTLPFGSSESPAEGEHCNTVTQQMFDDFCMSIFRRELADADTLDLHYTLRDPKAYDIVPGDVTLGTYQLEDMIYDNKETKALKAQLLSYDRSTLTKDQQLTYDTLLEFLNTSLLAEGLELYDQPLAPTIGVQAQLPILLAEYTFQSVDDIETYLSLLSQIDRYYAEILNFEYQKAAAGLGPSDTTIDAIIESCESYLFPTNFLTETFNSRIADLEHEYNMILSPEQKSDFTARHNEAIITHFLPAYQSLIDGMTKLKGRGINDGGLANWKNGKSYYTYLLKSGPGLSYTVSELKTALASRMEKDMDLLEELFLQYPDLEQQIQISGFSLTEPVEILEDLKQQIVHDFPVLETCDYEISYVPEALEETLSPAFYLTAPLDDTDHNIIYINNGYTDTASDLYTTLAHEGFPGHLYQTVYNRTHAKTPLLSILSCSGANEGWATYVENYACTLDNGLPPGVGEYRALIRSLSLCVYSALDIGINYDGWNREQAESFITSFFQVDESTVDELWQTMIDNPANYLEYCGGFLEIMEMREMAELELGDQFSLLDFHQFLLDIGPVPFSVMRNHFDDWLLEQHMYIQS